MLSDEEIDKIADGAAKKVFEGLFRIFDDFSSIPNFQGFYYKDIFNSRNFHWLKERLEKEIK